MNQYKPDPRQEWSTPDDFFKVVNEEFRFTLDAAATKQNAKCAQYTTPEMDALSSDVQWVTAEYRSVWLNPGFSDMEPWLKKAHQQVKRYEDSVIVVMALISTSSRWWRERAMKSSEIRLITGQRVQFVPADGVKKSSNSRDNCLIIFRHENSPDNYNPNERGARILTWDWTTKVKDES